jgi:hypothetical protein
MLKNSQFLSNNQGNLVFVGQFTAGYFVEQELSAKRWLL